jgi:hypothetical protein
VGVVKKPPTKSHPPIIKFKGETRLGRCFTPLFASPENGPNYTIFSEKSDECGDVEWAWKGICPPIPIPLSSRVREKQRWDHLFPFASEIGPKSAILSLKSDGGGRMCWGCSNASTHQTTPPNNQIQGRNERKGSFL